MLQLNLDNEIKLFNFVEKTFKKKIILGSRGSVKLNWVINLKLWLPFYFVNYL